MTFSLQYKNKSKFVIISVSSLIFTFAVCWFLVSGMLNKIRRDNETIQRETVASLLVAGYNGKIETYRNAMKSTVLNNTLYSGYLDALTKSNYDALKVSLNNLVYTLKLDNVIVVNKKGRVITNFRNDKNGEKLEYNLLKAVSGDTDKNKETGKFVAHSLIMENGIYKLLIIGPLLENTNIIGTIIFVKNIDSQLLSELKKEYFTEKTELAIATAEKIISSTDKEWTFNNNLEKTGNDFEFKEQGKYFSGKFIPIAGQEAYFGVNVDITDDIKVIQSIHGMLAFIFLISISSVISLSRLLTIYTKETIKK